ncbi:MAG TPA: hypothetical protein VF163_18480 [Micromonosporaceae bacterium]
MISARYDYFMLRPSPRRPSVAEHVRIFVITLLVSAACTFVLGAWALGLG